MSYKATLLYIGTFLLFFCGNVKNKASNTCITYKTAFEQRIGVVQFNCFNSQFKLAAILVKKATGNGFDITTAVNNNHENILISISKTTSGVQAFSNQQNQSSVWLNNKSYLLNNGQIELSTEGKILSGKFNAKLYEQDGNGGYKTTATQQIIGNFSGIIIP